MTGSWRTLVVGFAGGLILVLGEFADLIGVQIPDVATDGVFHLDTLVNGLALMGFGWFARDNIVKSETVGAK